MTLHACFASSVRLNLHISPVLPTKRERTRCALASDRASTPQTKVNNGKPKRTYRILPPNLPKSERPPPPPSHVSIPWIGYFIEEALGFETEYEKYQRLGPIFSSSYFLGPHIYVSDYQAIIEGLRDEDVFRTDGAFDVFKDLFGPETMIANDGEVHRRSRNAIAPAFSAALFPYYFETIRKRVNITWENVFSKTATGNSVKFADVFKAHYLSTAIELTTGVDVDSEEASLIADKFGKLQYAFFTPPFGPIWNFGIRARDEIIDILKNVISRDLKERADIIEKLREYGDNIVKLGAKDIAKGDVDVLLVLIANSSLSTEPNAVIDDEVVESMCYHMLLLWIAGYQTSAVTSTSASFELGRDESLLSKLVAEQDSIVAAAGGDNAVTYQQTVSEMPLLDSFIMEIVRLHPAGPVINRKVAKDIEILGHFIPKDSKFFLDVTAAQRDASYYPDPLSIVADRFVKKEGQPKPPALLSFGAPGSPHYCIGAALAKVLMKTTFATLLRQYTYTLKKGQSDKYNLVPEPVPASGVIVDSFRRRDDI